MSVILLRKVLRDLMARKASLIALVFIIGFGIASLVGFLSVSNDLEAAKASYFAQCRMGDFFVDVKRAPTWVVEEIASLPNVREARGRVTLRVVVDLPGIREPVAGTAHSLPAFSTPVINDVILRSGTWFSAPGAEEVLLNDAFAKANNLLPGSRLTTMLLDEQRELLVIGTVTSAEYIYQIPPGGGLAPDPKKFAALYFEESFIQEAGDLDGAFNQIIGTAEDTSDATMATMLALMKERLDIYGAIDAKRMNEQLSTDFLENELENVRKSSFITPVIFLSVAALILNVLVARMVQQQRSVIGTLKAVGFSSGQVFFHYLCYGLAIGFVGGAIGSVVGLGIHRAMIMLYQTIFEFPNIHQTFQPWIHLAGIAISMVASAAGTIKGTLSAVKLHPAEAMHPAPPEKAYHTPLEMFPRVWRRLSFRWKMVFRAIFRNPFRSAVSLFTGVVATMLIIGALAMRDGMKKLARYELEEVSHQDLSVTLRDPRGLGYDADERLIAGYTEPQLRVPADLSNGVHMKSIGVTGLPAGGTLYRPLDSAGNPIAIPATGLVLARKLAEILHVEVGDQVMLQPLIGERRKVTAQVAALVDTYVGLSAYADIEYLSRLMGEQWAANMILTKSFPGQSDQPLMSHLKEVRDVVGATRRAESLELFEQTFSKANAVIIGIFVVFAVIIGFGSVLNSSLVSLSERQREVATLRVLGFTTRQIAAIFASESAVLYGIGTIVGLYAGVLYIHFLAGAYSSELFRFPIVMRPVRFVTAALLMLGTIVSAQTIVMMLIAKLPWLEVLKVKE